MCVQNFPHPTHQLSNQRNFTAIGKSLKNPEYRTFVLSRLWQTRRRGPGGLSDFSLSSSGFAGSDFSSPTLSEKFTIKER